MQSSSSANRSLKPRRKKLAASRKTNSASTFGTRMEQLAKSGYTSQIRSAGSFRNARGKRRTVPDGRRAGSAAQNRAGFGAGRVYLGDGASDVPYSQQQRDRLVLRRQELETEMLQQNSIANTTRRRKSRKSAAGSSALGTPSLLLPADHVVWSVLASPGSTVTEGQTILDLADCTRRFVVVDLPEREFEQIKANESASVRLIGGDEWRQGNVRRYWARLPAPTIGYLPRKFLIRHRAVFQSRLNSSRTDPRPNVIASAILDAWPRSDSSERDSGLQIGCSGRLPG